MQALFYMDIRRDDSEEKLALFVASRNPSETVRSFLVDLVRGVTDAIRDAARNTDTFAIEVGVSF